MADKDQAVRTTGNELFEAFVEQVKQVLEHLYDFAYLQQHPLARIYDGDSDLSAKTAGRQLRHELITAIESLKPNSNAHFRAPDARLYNVLHLIYVENLTIQEVGAELGLSERQAYRDLKRGQETVAAVLWNDRLPPSMSAQEFSLQSEMARLKVSFSSANITNIFQQAQRAVERLASQQSIKIVVDAPVESLTLSTDAALAHQVMVSVLSNAIQQAQPGEFFASLLPAQDAVTLTLRYQPKEGRDTSTLTETTISALAQRLYWAISYQDTPEHLRQVVLRMTSRSATILVIEDNEGWVALLERFLEGFDCMVVAIEGGPDSVLRADELAPAAIMLDIMMPQKDGWELLQRLRTQPSTAHIPIIVCSVLNDPQLAYSLGASAFVSKPADREKILTALKDLSII